jgi:hypothetical protein
MDKYFYLRKEKIMNAQLKKTIALLTVFCLLFVLFPAQAFAASYEQVTFSADGKVLPNLKAAAPTLKGESQTPDGFYYDIDGDEAIIFGYDGENGDVTIPDTIDGKPVTKLLGYIFTYSDDETEIDTLTIGANVTYIDEQAFSYCQIDEFVVKAGNTAYMADADGVLFNSTKTILLQYPNGNNDSSYTIPAGVTQINAYAFYDANDLNTLILPSTLKTIGKRAFYSSEIHSITIPAAVTTIGESAFMSCYELTAINVNSANTKYASVSGVLFDKAKKTLITYPTGKTSSSFNIPGTVTKILADAIYNCNYIQTLGIPASVTSIQEGAIRYCYLLKTVNVSTSNTKYCSKDGVLFNKTKSHLILYPTAKTSTSYTVPSTVKYIDAYAFSGIRYLKTIKLPTSLTTIGWDAFSNAQALSSITFPKNLTSLGEGAFIGSPIKSVKFNSKLTAIPGAAFAGCENLTSVTIPKTIKKIGFYAFEYCKNLKTVTIPYQTVTMEEGIFINCPKLTLKVYKYSVAQTYASANKIKYKTIGTAPKCKISITGLNTAYGTVSGAGTFYYGKTCTLKATPKTGYKFTGWKEGSKTVSTKASYNFIVTKARTLKPVFAKE